jgi:hypothetical protein
MGARDHAANRVRKVNEGYLVQVALERAAIALFLHSALHRRFTRKDLLGGKGSCGR